MPRWLNILLAVLIIVVLVIIFIVSWYYEKKTPPPPGCENIGPDADRCSQCGEMGCHFYEKYHEEEDINEEETLDESDSSVDLNQNKDKEVQ